MKIQSILFGCIAVVFAVSHTYAIDESTPASAKLPVCPKELRDQYSCNTCFEPEQIYLNKGSIELGDRVSNPGGYINIYDKSELENAARVESSYPGMIAYTQPTFQIVDSFLQCSNAAGEKAWCGSNPPRFPDLYTYQNKGGDALGIRMKPGYGITATSIIGEVTASNRLGIREKALTVIYTLKPRYYDSASKSIVGSDTHVECQSIGVRFCGDGVKDADKGEECDINDGVTSGKKCNTSCKLEDIPVTPTPSCNALTASPVFGDSPFSTTLTCQGSDIPSGSTYSIDCGNGSTINGSSGVCVYTNSSTTSSLTKTPRCTIKANGTNYTSNACTTNVTVNAIVPSPQCSTSISGTLTVPISATTSGLCNVGTVENFKNPVTGDTTNYSWSCKNTKGNQSCSASYTTPPIPNPQCSTSISGALTVPISATTSGLCNVGTVENFKNPVTGDTTNYSWSCKNTKGNQSCSASYTTPTIPNPQCSTSISGTLTVPISATTSGLCNVGTVENFKNPVTGDTTNYSWSCKNTKGNQSCSASYTTPTIPNPQCSTSISGTLTVPISATTSGLCNVGTVENFKNPVTGDTTNYSWSCKNTKGNQSCSASYTTPTIPNPQCSTSISGTLTVPISATTSGLCNVGTVENFKNPVTGDTTNYSWSCKNTKGNQSCSASYTTPPIPNPQCSTSISGTLTVPISATTSGLCNVGTVENFKNPVTGDTTNYSWSCKNTKGNQSCSASYTTPPPPQGTLSIKKYAVDLTYDGQNGNNPAPVVRGSEFNYLYKLRVTGGDVNGAKLVDLLPRYVSYVRVGSKPANWQCHKSVVTTDIAHDLVECTTDDIIASGTILDFTVVAKLDMATPVNKEIQNIVTACKKSDPTCTPIICDPDTQDCCEILPDGTRDPACIVTQEDFDLSIKKYINSDDAESAIRLTTDGTFDYVLKVKNEGLGKVSGTTFITDTLPLGVERTHTATTTNGWDCTFTEVDRAFSCNIIREVASGAEFPEIRIPVKITAVGTKTITNEACVQNDREKDGKRRGQDNRNCDRAVFDITDGCGDGCTVKCESLEKSPSDKLICQGNKYARSYGVDKDGNGTIDFRGSFGGLNRVEIDVGGFGVGTYSPKCIVSSESVFPIAIGLNWSSEWSKYSGYIDSNESCKIGVTCTSGSCPPPPPPPCPPGSPSCPPEPLCGNGRLDAGEQCDVGQGYSPQCTASCQIPTDCAGNLVTVGYTEEMATSVCQQEGPILTISPTEDLSKEYNLGNRRIVNYINGDRRVFDPYKLVVGYQTPVFRSGDIIRLRSPGYAIAPNASGDSIGFNMQANPNDGPVGLPGQSNMISWNITGTECIGNYDLYSSYPERDALASVSVVDPSSPTGRAWRPCRPYSVSITSAQSQDIKGGLVSQKFVETNNATEANGYIGVPIYNFFASLSRNGTDIGKFPIQVRVTKPILANNAGGAGYAPTGISPDDGFVSMEEIAAGFLETLGVQKNFNVGTTTNTAATSTGFSLDKIVRSSDQDLSAGPTAWAADSKTILRHFGDTRIGQSGVPTTVTGKKTLVVKGILFIDGNIASSDSVAFIADEIRIATNVTRLDGIYIANRITGTPASGQLIVNGSLYGDADVLVTARTYARGSSATQGIVTGILINYSSRVLSNPPPLVSDFLKQYQLTKVTSVQ